MVTAPAGRSRLPYDRVVDSAELGESLSGESFDIIIDPVGGNVRTESLNLMAPGGRLLVCGNASGDWDHSIGSNDLWLRSVTVSGFNSGAYLPTHPDAIRPPASKRPGPPSPQVSVKWRSRYCPSPRRSPPTNEWKAARWTAGSPSPRMRGHDSTTWLGTRPSEPVKTITGGTTNSVFGPARPDSSKRRKRGSGGMSECAGPVSAGAWQDGLVRGIVGGESPAPGRPGPLSRGSIRAHRHRRGTRSDRAGAGADPRRASRPGGGADP
ncbi:zinc-binding dehydrogenase [Streptomyces sp. NPDC051217]|uniref:zinc-binding dehydrogenase n=1 Tax=Streptomyces sp. NPDC051217 TaxID=3365644 RepID=UPI0037A185CA